MKFTYLAAFLFGATLAMNAQGYKDGIEYYKAGQFDNAITILNRNMNNPETDKAMANYYLGQSYLVKGDNTKALDYFQKGVQADDKCGYNYVGLGAIELMNGNKSAAEKYFKQAESLAKKNGEIPIDIARAYFYADNDENKQTYAKEIDKKIEKARKDTKNQEPAIYIFEGDRKAYERDFNAAAQWYDQAISFDSDNPEGYVKYANVYFYVVPDFAIKKLEELLQKNPNSALAQRELAEKYFANGQIGKATEQYRKYIENPNHFSQDKSRYVVLLFTDGQYENAIKNAKEILAEENPNDLPNNRLILRSYAQLENRDDEALQFAQKFFANPEFQGRFNSGDYQSYYMILSRVNKLEEAESLLKTAAEALPEDATILKLLATNEAAMDKNNEALDTYIAYMNLVKEPTEKDYEQGSRMALAAVTANKDNDELRNKYAQIGLDYISKIPDAEKSASVMLRKVQILLNQNKGLMDADAEVAIKELIAALDANPVNADPTNESNNLNLYRSLYSQLASYYERNGKTADAKAAKDKLAEINDLLK